MKKRFGYIAFLTLVLSVLAIPGLAHAHVLKQDNGVSSVMHVAPFDAPVSGEATRIEFQFGGAGTFALHDYNIYLHVRNDGKQVSEQTIMPAFLGTSTLGIASVTFPKAGVYDLLVNGTSLNGTSHSFTLDYQVRVTSGSPSNTSTNNGTLVLEISGALIVVFIMFSARQLIAGKRYNKIT